MHQTILKGNEVNYASVFTLHLLCMLESAHKIISYSFVRDLLYRKLLQKTTKIYND